MHNPTENVDKDLEDKWKEFARSDLFKNLVRGRAYAALRALQVFDSSKDAMLKEMATHPHHGGFYQVVLMLAEAIAHEEMATAFNSVIDIVMDEIFKMHKADAGGKTAKEFKDELKKDLRGELRMAEMIEMSGFADGIRQMIRSSI